MFTINKIINMLFFSSFSIINFFAIKMAQLLSSNNDVTNKRRKLNAEKQDVAEVNDIKIYNPHN